ncbi:MAG: enoyl-CoA hydratase/isomerase family protein [Cytophagaceae bacterium]|nr:enoyl-CoA hydratase/isomerase family protein [Cytophagaceae bacterium]
MNFVNYDTKERIAYVTINRAEKRNALNSEVIRELKFAFLKAQDNPDIKIVILKAEGEVFCAGADLEYLQQLQKNSYAENLADSTNLMELYKIIYTHKKVVIAQVNGHAIAGGAGLVSVCDFAFTVPAATFGYTEVKIGFIPAIVMVFLLRKIGEARSKELLLSGNIISAQDAKTIGLIYSIEEPNQLENAVYEFAQKLCASNSGNSLELTKQMIADVQGMKLDDALKYAAEMNAKARSTEDCQRGIAAFLSKQKITW